MSAITVLANDFLRQHFVRSFQYLIRKKYQYLLSYRVSYNNIHRWFNSRSESKQSIRSPQEVFV